MAQQPRRRDKLTAGMTTLVYSDVDGVERTFELGYEQVLIGRGAECAIRSDDPRVSRVHARIFVDQETLWIEDAGSANGVFLGPNKISRAPIPLGEVIVIGSIMLRVLGHDGTVPPPVGIHGTLAQWLINERKNRVGVEQERDAFAQRVAELHSDIRTLVAAAAPSSNEAELVRLRDEAEARAAGLERALAAVQQELNEAQASNINASSTLPGGMARADAADAAADERLATVTKQLERAQDRVRILEQQASDKPQWSSVGAAGDTAQLDKLKLAADEANAARKVAESTAATERADANRLRAELDQLKKASNKETESLRFELAKAKEAVAVADAQAGLVAAEKVAEAERQVAALRSQLDAATSTAQAAGPANAEQAAKLAKAIERADKAEKKLAAAEIRAQGAERNVAHANAQTATAERRAGELEARVTEAESRTVELDEALTEIKEQFEALRANMGPGANSAEDATRRAIAAEDVAKQKQQELEGIRAALAAERDAKIAELEAVRADLAALQKRETNVRAELASATAEVAELVKKLAGAEKMLADNSDASEQIAAARRERDEARDEAIAARTAVEKSKLEVEQAEKRAAAADTIAKSMAKDVSDSMRRAVEADSKNKNLVKEVAAAQQRVVELEALRQQELASVQQAQATITEAQATTAQLERALDAERASSLALVDRKNQLERELEELRHVASTHLAASDALMAKIANFDNEIETLNDRITDLESQLQIERTAAQLSIDEAKAAARMGVDRAQHAAEAAVMAARTEAAAITAQVREQAAADVMAMQTKAQAELADAQAQAQTAVAAAEAKLAALQSQLSDSQSIAMETARAGEPLRARVTTLEADVAKAKTALEKANADRHASEENVARLRDELASLRAQPRPQVDADGYAALLARAEEAESNVARLAGKADAADLAIGRASAVQRQLDEALSRLARIEHGRVSESGLDATRNARLQALEADVASAEARSRELGSRVESLSRELADTKAALADAERAHAAALRDAQHELAQATAFLATRDHELHSLRQATESRSKNFADPEVTVSAPNLARYEAAVAELNVLRGELGTLREELAAAKHRAATTSTHAAGEPALSAAALEQLSILEESIDSLRANLRAASDETAMMPSSESVTIIADAISQAAEHVERARDALRTITNL